MLWSPNQPSTAPSLSALCCAFILLSVLLVLQVAHISPPSCCSPDRLMANIFPLSAKPWPWLPLLPSATTSLWNLTLFPTLCWVWCCLKSPAVWRMSLPTTLCVILGQSYPGSLRQFGISLVTFAYSFTSLPMHCEVLSPARQKLSVHQPVIRLLTFSLSLGTLMQLPGFALETHLCHYVLLLVSISPCLVWLLCLLLCSWGRAFCLNWGLVLKCFKPAGCTYKFAVFYDFSLTVDQIQCPVTFGLQSQPDHPVFLWQPNLALTFSITTLMRSWAHPKGSWSPGLQYTPSGTMCTHFLQVYTAPSKSHPCT